MPPKIVCTQFFDDESSVAISDEGLAHDPDESTVGPWDEDDDIETLQSLVVTHINGEPTVSPNTFQDILTILQTEGLWTENDQPYLSFVPDDVIHALNIEQITTLFNFINTEYTQAITEAQHGNREYYDQFINNDKRQPFNRLNRYQLQTLKTMIIDSHHQNAAGMYRVVMRLPLPPQ